MADDPIANRMACCYPLTEANLAAHTAAKTDSITCQDYIKAWIKSVEDDI